MVSTSFQEEDIKLKVSQMLIVLVILTTESLWVVIAYTFMEILFPGIQENKLL